MALDTVGYIHSRETFGTVDGPGIRYVLFLQGCFLRCLYCHNPDTQEFSKRKPMTVAEVIEDFSKYEPYLNDGGITLSGGESLTQIDFVIDLFTELKKLGVHTTLDTSGATFMPDVDSVLEKFDRLIAVTDLFLLDIKEIDDEDHKILVGVSNKNILAFLKYLDDNEKTVWIRHVIVPGYTYEKDKLLKLGYEFSKYSCIEQVDPLPYHDMGRVKYEALGREYPLGDTPTMTKSHAQSARKIIMYAMAKPKEVEVYFARKGVALA